MRGRNGRWRKASAQKTSRLKNNSDSTGRSAERQKAKKMGKEKKLSVFRRGMYALFVIIGGRAQS